MKYKATDYRIPAHATGDIMTDADGMITEKQLATIAEYDVKKTALTEKQQAEYGRLIYKRDNPQLAVTTRKRLAKMFAFKEYGRTEDLENKYLLKGLHVEDEAIRLYSQYKGEVFVKNEIRQTDEHATGEPDIIIDEVEGTRKFDDGSIKPWVECEEGVDIKSSWDFITFMAATEESLKKDYFAQGQVYMKLFNAKRWTFAYVLVNTPRNIINGEKIRLMRKLGTPTEGEDQEAYYAQALAELEHNHIFDDIPLERRVMEITIERDDAYIARFEERVELCWKYLEKKYYTEAEQL